MSTRNVTTHNLPFPAETLHTDDPEEQELNHRSAEFFRKTATPGVLMSLGATNLTTVPGTHRLGGLLLIARILPLTEDRRGETAHRMAVMISHTVAELIDIDVRHLGGHEHATAYDLYSDQLRPALVALDYDGPTAFNPRYWPN